MESEIDQNENIISNENNNLSKDFKSAIIVGVPEELNTQIQEFRKKYDKSFVRWMPHINLIFPFVKIQDFSKVYEELRREMLEFKSFKLVFNEISYFQHGNSCVVWLKPSTPDNPNIINKIQNKLQELLPGFDELSKKSDKGFQPHLTIGQFPTKGIEPKIQSLQNEFKPIEFEVTEIYMINRRGDTPFQIENTLKFSN